MPQIILGEHNNTQVHNKILSILGMPPTFGQILRSVPDELEAITTRWR